MNDEIVKDRQAAVAPPKASSNRNELRTRLIAGVSVPDGPLITAAIEYAQRISEPYLFNHAMRSWLFAELIGRTKGIDYDHEVVAIGTILHDISLTAAVSGPNRFEVNGADAAELDAIACASQGARGGGWHDGHRTRLRRIRP
jgi:hypothetical protein